MSNTLVIVAGLPNAIPLPPLRKSIVKNAGESKVTLED